MRKKELNELNLEKLSDKKYFDSLSIKELNEYASLIREYLIEICSKKSTHLASNLGTVEIFLALNRVFDFDKDYFTFDVGHQIYTYKILTKRLGRFPTLREFQGLSGFPDPEESSYDLFKVGHVGCGLPLALGLSAAGISETTLDEKESEEKKDEAKVKSKNKRQIVTLLGDGALTNGAMLEALSFISNRKNGKIIIILNDNGMSISRTVPSITKKLSLFATKLNIRGSLEQQLKRKGHSVFIESLMKFFRSLKNLILPRQIFEDFGIRYIGPIDGHNIKELVDYFTFAKNFPQTILVHVKTTKGKGFAPAENNPELFHSAPPFDPVSGEIKQASNSFTNVFGQLIYEKAKINNKIFAITAAMKTGCGLDKFEQEFSDRFIDVGIAESLAVSMAAGLAKAGKFPVVAMYSIFLQRATAQVYHDVVLNHLPVFFAIDRAGLVGIDGPTHHGIYTYPFLYSLPDIYLFNCGFVEDMQDAFSLLGNIDLPVFMQYPKDTAKSFNDEIKDLEKQLNIRIDARYIPSGISSIYLNCNTDINLICNTDNNIVKGDKKIAVVSVGSSFSICKDAFMEVYNEKIKQNNANNIFDFYYISKIKPFDEENAKNLINKYDDIIIVDEAPSSYIFEIFSKISSSLKISKSKISNSKDSNIKNSNIHLFSLPDVIIPHGTRAQLFEYIGFSKKQLVNLINEINEK